MLRKFRFVAIAALGVGTVISLLVASISMGFIFGLPGQDFELKATRVTGTGMRLYGGTHRQSYTNALTGVLINEMATANITGLAIKRQMTVGTITLTAHIEGSLATGSGIVMKVATLDASKIRLDNMTLEELPDNYGGVEQKANTVTIDNLVAQCVFQGATVMTIDNLHMYLTIP